jgi:hypothetical protein
MKRMRLFNFSFGDEVRITRTNLTGTLVKVGGNVGVVEINGIPVCYDLTRLRHLDSFGVLTLRRGKKKITQITNKIKYYAKSDSHSKRT